MASKEKSTRFHPYDTNKKPKIHRSNTENTTTTTAPKRKRSHDASTTQKQPTNKNSTGDKGLSINDLKKRIRDVKRLLTRVETLSPEARIVQERALKGYERDLEQEQARRQRSEMIKKYHFVRFLDRKTATKQLRTAQRQYEMTKQQQDETGKVDSAKLATLQKQIDIAQININYTIYYPLTEKYISLDPQEKKRQVLNGHNEIAANTDDSNDDDEKMQTSEDDTTKEKEDEKPPMWDIIKKCMAEKTLDKLRDGKLNIGFDGKPIQRLETATTTSTSIGASEVKKDKVETTTATRKEKEKEKNKSKRKEVELEHQKEDEDSDGGFFEE